MSDQKGPTDDKTLWVSGNGLARGRRQDIS